MQLLDVKKTVTAGTVRLDATVKSDAEDDTIRLHFTYPEEYAPFVVENADPFVAALLLPAMWRGERLHVLPPVSERLLQGQETIQDIYHAWYPQRLKKVLVTAANPAQFNKRSCNAVGAFFSLGVDSFYTLLKNMHQRPWSPTPISHLIFIKGLEAPLSWYEDGREAAVISHIREVAKETNLYCLVGETNIRDHFPLNWARYYDGAGLAATALSLSSGFDYVLIPAGYTYGNVFPCGSSPLTTYLWSTNLTTIIHDGAEMPRARKIAKVLANNSLALRKLRVCTSNKGADGNCGECQKCLRTMMSLDICGALERAITFPDRLPHDYARRLTLGGTSSLFYAEDNLQLAKEYCPNKAITKVLTRAVDMARIREFRSRYQKRTSQFAMDVGRYLVHRIGKRVSALAKKAWAFSRRIARVASG